MNTRQYGRQDHRRPEEQRETRKQKSQVQTGDCHKYRHVTDNNNDKTEDTQHGRPGMKEENGE